MAHSSARYHHGKGSPSKEQESTNETDEAGSEGEAKTKGHVLGSGRIKARIRSGRVYSMDICLATKPGPERAGLFHGSLFYAIGNKSN